MAGQASMHQFPLQNIPMPDPPVASEWTCRLAWRAMDCLQNETLF